MFEAIHGSAPRRAGQNLANPSGLLQGAIMMLSHLGQNDIAENIQNAWLKTIEDGIHTYDIFKDGVSKEKVGTKEFAEAVIANLGGKPQILKGVSYSKDQKMILPTYHRKPAQKKDLEGVDLFIHWSGTDPNQLAEIMKHIQHPSISLSMITNRGIKVWPNGFKETFCTDHWRCRFKPSEGNGISKLDIIDLLNQADNHGIDVVKTENLYSFNGVRSYSLGQGQ